VRRVCVARSIEGLLGIVGSRCSNRWRRWADKWATRARAAKNPSLADPLQLLAGERQTAKGRCKMKLRGGHRVYRERFAGGEAPMLTAWLRAFALTQAIEVPIYRRGLGCGSLEAFCASTITHPLVFWFCTSGWWPVHWALRAAACELFAWVVDAFYFALLGRSRAFLWSSIANAASFGFGLVCWSLFRLQ
jgi:hypothetical protein